VTAALAKPLSILLSLLSASTTLPGCGGGECFDVPTVQARMPATVERSGNTSNILLSGDTVDDPYNNPYLHGLLLSDISQSPGGATWTLSAPGNPGDILDWLTIQLQGSFQPGDVIQVTQVPESWLNTWNDAPEGARGVYVSAPGFTTTSVSGTIEVLRVAPLGLRLDVLAANEAGEEVRVRGDMVASAGQFQSCSD
jgi:hypothetical protein